MYFWPKNTDDTPEFRQAIFKELQASKDVYTAAWQVHQIADIAKEFDRDMWLNYKLDECKKEVELRSLFLPIEKKVRAKHGGDTLPDWFTQSRDWQIIDRHLKESKFVTPGDGCKRLG